MCVFLLTFALAFFCLSLCLCMCVRVCVRALASVLCVCVCVCVCGCGCGYVHMGGGGQHLGFLCCLKFCTGAMWITALLLYPSQQMLNGALVKFKSCPSNRLAFSSIMFLTGKVTIKLTSAACLSHKVLYKIFASTGFLINSAHCPLCLVSGFHLGQFHHPRSDRERGCAIRCISIAESSDVNSDCLVQVVRETRHKLRVLLVHFY